MKAALAVLCLCQAAFAQSFPLHFDLSGDWRFHVGDSPEFAKPAFDDGTWRKVQLPQRGDRPIGYWWLRRTVRLPEGTDTSQLAITLGAMNEVYEVFLNGTRVAAVGEPKLSKTFTARPRTFPIPAGVVDAGTPITIAIRLWYAGFVTSTIRTVNSRYPDSGPYLLSYQDNAPPNVAAASLAARERGTIPAIVIAELEGALALLVLVVWLMQRERAELAFLAAFLLSGALFLLNHFVTRVWDWSAVPIAGIAVTLTPLLLAYFASRSLGVKALWISLVQWIFFLLNVALTALVVWTDGRPDLAAPYNWVAQTSVVGQAPIFLMGLVMLWRCLQRRDWNGAWMPTAVAVLAFLMSQRVSGGWQIIPTNLVVRGMAWNLTDILTILVALGTTVHLIRTLSAARQRLAGEMEAARAVQQLLLMDALVGAGSPYQIDAAYVPAHEVGGDFYKILECADGSRIVVAGDVSGKGLKAAMVVSMVIGALANRRSDRPAALLSEMNRALYGRLDGGFVTCCCALIEPSGRMEIANAGHPTPWLAGREVEVAGGLPLGLVADTEYEVTACRLAPGEQLTIVSDGVVEAANAKGELFGFDRTRGISERGTREIAETARIWGQNDDISVVTVRWNQSALA